MSRKENFFFFKASVQAKAKHLGYLNHGTRRQTLDVIFADKVREFNYAWNQSVGNKHVSGTLKRVLSL